MLCFHPNTSSWSACEVTGEVINSVWCWWTWSLVKVSSLRSWWFCLATRRNPGGTNKRRRSENARQLSATQAKRFFIVKEDLSTGYFTTSFPFFQVSHHNSKLTDTKREIKREVKRAAKIQNCTRITQYTRTIDDNPFVMRPMISFAYVSENYQPPFASRFCWDNLQCLDLNKKDAARIYRLT